MLNIQRTKKSHDSNFSFHCEKSVQASSCDELQVVLAHSSIYDVLFGTLGTIWSGAFVTIICEYWCLAMM